MKLTFFTAEFKMDCIVVAALVLAAFLVRVPYISHPAETVFDEYYYATLVSNDVHGWRYFSYHPPLSTMIFSVLLDKSTPSYIGDTIRLPYNSFPFERVRFMSVLAGSLIPGFIYIVFRRLKILWKFALLGAGITVFDSLLITYSRLILPDTFLWICGLLSIIFALIAVKSNGYYASLCGCFSAFFIGLAISVKWTGLVFGVVALLAPLIFTMRPLRNVFYWSMLGSVLVFVTYVGVVTLHLRNFESGYIDPSRNIVDVSSKELFFPDPHNIFAVIRFIKSQIRLSIQLQTVSDIHDKIFNVGRPDCWPLSCGSFGGWYSDRSRLIFGGNIPAFAMSALSILLLAVFYGISLLKRGSINVQKEEIFIFLSFAGIYIPTVIVAAIRPMFLYHYVPAYIFALAALSLCLVRLCQSDARIGKIAVRAVIVLVFIFFLIQSPYTYGF